MTYKALRDLALRHDFGLKTKLYLLQFQWVRNQEWLGLVVHGVAVIR